MSWFKKLFGPTKPAPIAPGGGSPGISAEPRPGGAVIAEDDPRIAQGQDMVHGHWRKFGALDDDVISYIVNPSFMGAPPWPNQRQAYRVLRRGESVILASDGLSDPFVGTGRNDTSGYGLELWIEAPGLQDADFDSLKADPAFRLLEIAAQNVAGHGGVAALLDKLGGLSMAIPMGAEAPEGWADADGQVGLLIGLQVPEISTRLEAPFGPIRTVCLTPLRPDETEAIVKDVKLRDTLIIGLLATPSAHRVDWSRESAL